MRLLNVYTFKLAEFEGKNVPPYAVASHRWCDNEATYIDVEEGKNKDREGYKKIQGFCEFVKWRNNELKVDRKLDFHQKIDWIWIDTCCIDRRSSAEIAENITSMYKYYEQSVECYAYLSDVPESSGPVNLNAFRASNWFTRGWTLQELVAPSRLFFLSSTWSVFGHKCSNRRGQLGRNDLDKCHYWPCNWGNFRLNFLIRQITGISAEVLGKRLHPKSLPPDQICKWIDRRETKKEEDLAYCLLGLFGVSMLANYGEGENAWSRLEEEVNKKRKREGQREVSLPRPSQMQPDEERYEPSIFNVTIPYSVPSDQNSRRAVEHRRLEEEEERQARLEHNRLAESNARQGAGDAAAFREGLSIRTSEDTPRDASPERHRQAADSDSASLMSDLSLTPDSEPDVHLHWINDLPTLEARNQSRRRRRSFDISERNRQPYAEPTSDRPLYGECEHPLRREMIEKLKLETARKRREEEEVKQRFQEENEKKRKEVYEKKRKEECEFELMRKQRVEEEEEKEIARKEMYEFKSRRKQREEEELKARAEEEEKDQQRRKLKQQVWTVTRMREREGGELRLERQNAEDFENLGDAERQPRSRSRSRKSRDIVLVRQPTSSPDQATAASTSSWQSSLGALNPLRLLQPSPPQTLNDKTEDGETHDTGDQLLSTRPGLTRRTRDLSSPHRHYTVSNGYTVADDGTIIYRDTDRTGGKKPTTTIHVGRGYRSTRTHAHSRRCDEDLSRPQDFVTTEA